MILYVLVFLFTASATFVHLSIFTYLLNIVNIPTHGGFSHEGKNDFRLTKGIQNLVTFMNLLETYTVLATFLHCPICNFYVLNIHLRTIVSEVPVILFQKTVIKLCLCICTVHILRVIYCSPTSVLFTVYQCLLDVSV